MKSIHSVGETFSSVSSFRQAVLPTLSSSKKQSLGPSLGAGFYLGESHSPHSHHWRASAWSLQASVVSPTLGPGQLSDRDMPVT